MWLPISPQVYLDRVQRQEDVAGLREIRSDVSGGSSRDLVAEFQRRGIPHELAVLPCGHYSTGVTPFKYPRRVRAGEVPRPKSVATEHSRTQRKPEFLLCASVNSVVTRLQVVQQPEKRLVDDACANSRNERRQSRLRSTASATVTGSDRSSQISAAAKMAAMPATPAERLTLRREGAHGNLTPI